MKAKNQFQILSIFLLFVWMSVPALAKSDNLYEKTISKEFVVNPDVQLVLSGKYGDMHLTTNKSNKVSITIQVSIETKNDRKGQDKLDEIQFDISGNAKKVEAITKDFSGNFNKLDINWQVSLPEGASLVVDEQFGDVYINSINGKTDFTVKYGKLEASELRNAENKLHLEFSKAKIEKSPYIDAYVRYSKGFELGEVKHLIIDSQYSTLDIQSVGRIELKSAYDNIDIDAVAEIISKSKFTDIELDWLTQKAEMTTSYGDIEINSIENDFKGIDVDASFSDVELTFKSGVSIDLDAYASFGDISIPSGYWKKEKGDFSETVRGAHNGGHTEVRVRLSYGDLKIGVD